MIVTETNIKKKKIKMPLNFTTKQNTHYLRKTFRKATISSSDSGSK